jgi:sugar diacid utilization regulator
LTALLAATLDASVAANRLGVHRNTLTYRLRHFEQVTGLAPQRRFADAALCFFLATPADRPPA